MSGIGGIINLDGRLVSSEALKKMARTLSHKGPDGEFTWIEKEAGLFCQMLRLTPESEKEKQPAVHPDGFVLVYDGRLDNREELISLLKGKPGVFSGCPDTNLVLAAYHEFYLDFPEKLDGDFAIGLYHPVKKQLILVRDSVGVRPLYYFSNDNILAFSTEIKALLTHPNVPVIPDDEVLSSFIFQNVEDGFNGKTFFKDIYSVSPGSMCIAEPGKCYQKQYWDFDVTRRNNFKSPEEYFERFRELFERSVKNRMRNRDKTALSLSGGLDSSSIYCVAQELTQSGKCSYPGIYGLTYSSADGSVTDEMRFITAMENKYGTSIKRLGLSPPSLMHDCRRQVWHSETPFIDGLSTSGSNIMQTVRDSGSSLWLTGIWGDQALVNQAYLVDLFRQGRWGMILSHLRQFKWWCRDVNPAYFRSNFFRDMLRYNIPESIQYPLRKQRRRWSVQSVKMKFYSRSFWEAGWHREIHKRREFQGATAHSKALFNVIRSKSYKRWMEWSSKISAMYGLEAAYPFFDRNLLSFLLANPGQINSWKGVPKGILREGLREILPQEIKQRRWKADFTKMIYNGLYKDFGMILELFKKDSLVVERGYVQERDLQGALQSLRREINDNNIQISSIISDLIGLETWLREFFSGEKT